MIKRALLSTATVALIGAGVMACSDPVPPTAQGGFKLRLVSGNNPNCGQADAFVKVGDADGKTKSEVSDGGDYRIVCSVKKNGGGYDFSGSVTQASTAIVFSISASGATAGTETAASVQISSKDTQTNTFSSNACTITLVTDAVPAASIGPGRIYAAFSCPKVIEPTAMKTCSIAQFDGNGTIGGYVAFDNCDE
jgi:hypothetical protein